MKLKGCEMEDSLGNCTNERCPARSFATGHFECAASAGFQWECAKASGEKAFDIFVARDDDCRRCGDARAGHRTTALDDSVCIFRLDQRSKSKSSWLWNLGDVHLLPQPRIDRRRRSDRGSEEGGEVTPLNASPLQVRVLWKTVMSKAIAGKLAEEAFFRGGNLGRIGAGIDR